jgi:type IV pilus assembly protein PilW
MRHARGFSLIELLVALAIGLLIVLALTVIIVRVSGTQRELGLANRQLESGRFALQSISDDLHNAGYIGPVANIPAPPSPGTAVPNLCATGSAVSAEFLKAPGVGAFPLAVRPSCIAAADHVAGTDILAVVHASSIITPMANLTSAANVGRLFIQTDTQSIRLALASSNAGTNEATFNLLKKDLATPADIRGVQVYIYYVSPCNRPASGQTTCTSAADDGQPVPTLRRMILDGDSFVTQAVAEGVENLQIELGLDTTGNDAAPDQYKAFSSADPVMADLTNATAVAVHLLVRNTEKTVGFSDGKSYTLGGTTVSAPNDAYKRHVFSRVVRLHNNSGRRAS